MIVFPNGSTFIVSYSPLDIKFDKTRRLNGNNCFVSSQKKLLNTLEEKGEMYQNAMNIKIQNLTSLRE